MFVAGYGHFLRTAASLQWDEAAIDLRADARGWRALEASRRVRLGRLVAGFCVAEAAVAREIVPFAEAASDPDVAACFEMQAVDELRHARFFDRVAAQVVGVSGDTASARLGRLRSLLEPAFVDLFERRLPAAARALADAAGDGLREPVLLYHLLLEGIVFSAGQLAMQRELDLARPPLAGLRRGLELVLADERWHIGLGARLLEDMGASPGNDEDLLASAASWLASWGPAVDADIAERTLALHRRRLRAARIAAPAPTTGAARVQATSSSSSGPPRTPLATATS